MVCLDNSEWMRNGDYIPTRLDAQQDAANLVSNAKTQQNPENTVGVLSMAGSGRHSGATLLASPTDDMGKILASLHGVKIAGKLNFLEGVQVAQLALKHRRNKNGGQRIVLFVGSPIDADAKSLVKAAKLLKKNNIAVDVVSMGETEDNREKIQEFVDTVNSNDNSNLITIPPGVMPSDVLISSPVIQQDMANTGGAGGDFGSGAAAAPTGGDAGMQDLGVDPNLDPELAMALRVSMEEERARQEAASKSAADAAADGAPGAEMEVDSAPAAAAASGEDAPAAAAAPTPTPAAAAPETVARDAEEELLQQALAMSMQDTVVEPAPEAPAAAEQSAMQTDADEDEAMQLALQMSLQGGPAAAAPVDAPAGAADTGTAQQFHDPAFVNRMLASLPGVDPSDPQIQAALQRINQTDEQKRDDKPDADKK